MNSPVCMSMFKLKREGVEALTLHQLGQCEDAGVWPVRPILPVPARVLQFPIKSATKVS